MLLQNKMSCFLQQQCTFMLHITVNEQLRGAENIDIGVSHRARKVRVGTFCKLFGKHIVLQCFLVWSGHAQPLSEVIYHVC